MFSADDVHDALRAHPVVEHPALPGRRNHLSAGVLVPLAWRDGGVDVLLTRRTRTLSRHAGEVSFPGGRRDPTDADLRETALREAREELGIHAPRVLGALCSMPVFTSDYRLHPWVAEVRDEELVPQPAEVAEIIRFDLLGLCAAGVEGIHWEFDGRRGVSPVFRGPSDTLVFGATAHTLHELLEVVAPVAIGAALPPLRRSPLTWGDVTAWADAAAG